MNDHTNGVNGHTNGTDGINGHSSSAICSSAEEFLAHEYDFVIVGGGTAGLVVAARLTENPDVTVGVIEAGKNRLGDMLVDTPALFLQMLGNEDYDWKFHTTPQACLPFNLLLQCVVLILPQEGNKGNIHHMVRGKMLGGSSGINYMMYVRGSNQDYNDWAALAEDASWSHSEMIEYMRKHQTLEPIDESITERSTMPFVGEYHGTSGPVRTSFNDWILPLDADIIKACDEVTGMTKKPKDPWSGDHIGFYNTLGLVARTGPNRGKRSYAARGYLEANKHRPNLKVLCEALSTNIVLEGNVAKGVAFMHNGTKYTVNAKKEVVVSCGVIQSPQLLELSGIGDPEVLKAAGVECKIENLGVGNNFQDHSLTIGCYELAPGVMSLDAIYDPTVMADAQKTLMEKAGGPLTGISSCQGFFPYKLFASDEELKETVQSIKDTKVRSPYEKKQLEQIIAHLESDTSANLQMVAVCATGGYEHGIQDQSKLFPQVDPSKGMGATLAICLQYPVSRGSVHIASSDPAQHPTIDPGYIRHPADVNVLAAGLRMVDKVAKSSHLKDKFAKRQWPAPEIDLQDIEQSRAAVRDWVLSEYHPIGSCAMGSALDSRLRVKGVSNLRVVDASVFPNNVSGNIVSSVYATAEKAADAIKVDHHYAALKKAVK